MFNEGGNFADQADVHHLVLKWIKKFREYLILKGIFGLKILLKGGMCFRTFFVSKVPLSVDFFKYKTLMDYLCSRCKKPKTRNEIGIKKNNQPFKLCVSCRTKEKIIRNQRKCLHGKRKNLCKYCGGDYLCVHGRNKYQCTLCLGVKVCVHGNRKYSCRDCGSVSFCVHAKKRRFCKECNGKEICIHNKQRYFCKDCNGSSICTHGRQKSTCKECGGTSVCPHNKQKRVCLACLPLDALKNIVLYNMRQPLKKFGLKPDISYLNMSIEDYHKYLDLEVKAQPGLSWNNHGTMWELAHIVTPLHNKPCLVELLSRFDATNTTPKPI